MKLYIANVGVNSADAAARGIKSPIFPDGTFEFLPIKEKSDCSAFVLTRYDTIHCVNNPSRTLSDYVQEPYGSYAVHNDPEFETFTYGDVDTAWGGNLRDIGKGDILLFLAKLCDYREGSGFTHGRGFYFIGYLTVDFKVEFNNGHAQSNIQEIDEIKNNAHLLRLQEGGTDVFRVIRGDPSESFRFKKALPITPEIAGMVFNGKYDKTSDCFISNMDSKTVLNKNSKPTMFKRFHSKTRTVQAFLNSEVASEKESIDELMAVIRVHCFDGVTT